jgi:hypothetical protein
MRRPFVATFAATAVLAQGGCDQKLHNPEGITHNPPPIEASSVPISENPPAQRGWDDTPSNHRGTNPPSPVLVISNGGLCFKKWEGGMTQAGPNRVEADCSGHKCGTSISCPEGAAKLLQGGKAEIGEKKAVELANGSKRGDAAVTETSKPSVKLYGNRYIVSYPGPDGGPQSVNVFVDAITGKILADP